MTVCENCEQPIGWYKPSNSALSPRWIHEDSRKEECAVPQYAHPKEGT